MNTTISSNATDISLDSSSLFSPINTKNKSNTEKLVKIDEEEEIDIIPPPPIINKDFKLPLIYEKQFSLEHTNQKINKAFIKRKRKELKKLLLSNLVKHHDNILYEEQEELMDKSINNIKKYTDFKQMHLSLKLDTCELSVNDPNDSNLEAYISLYNYQMKQFISEEYCITISSVSNGNKADNLQHKIIFIDLIPPDLGDLHAVVKIFRIGTLNILEKDKRKIGAVDVRRPYAIAVLPLSINNINESLSNNSSIINIPQRIKCFNISSKSNEKGDKLFDNIQDEIIKYQANNSIKDNTFENIQLNLDCGGINYNFQYFMVKY